MKSLLLTAIAAASLVVIALAGGGLAGAAPASASVDWHMNATAIEACSCPMFCQCYFNAEPGAGPSHEHGAHHFCKFNMGYKINQGNMGGTKLDGVKFWISGDLGGDFSKGKM